MNAVLDFARTDDEGMLEPTAAGGTEPTASLRLRSGRWGPEQQGLTGAYERAYLDLMAKKSKHMDTSTPDDGRTRGGSALRLGTGGSDRLVWIYVAY